LTGGAAFNPTQREWLGSLPRHWSTPPLRRLARIENGRDYKDIEVDEGGYPVVGSGGAFARAGAYLCEGPSVLLGRKGTIDRPQYVDEPFWAVDTSFFTLVARDVSTRFFFYFALTIPFGYFEAGTALPSMTKSNLYTIRCPLPPLDEQHALADFLDRETEKIDTLVAKKQRLIELLQEKRTALISHAVTKGLDPDVPMKDSGIDQLGQIPSHWMAERLAMLTDKITNGFVGPTRDILLDQGVTYLQSLHIKENRITFGDDYFVSPEWSRQHAKSVLKTGDVLVVQTGDIGQVAVVPPKFEGANCHALIIMSPVRSLASGEYLSWALNSHYGYHALKRIQTGALHPHLNCTFVREIVCPLPPLGEQAHVVQWVRDQNDRHDRLLAALEQAIRRLEEYRSALITATVTGQIDVGAR
jgi:type I restriction enzyme, S subunit